MEKLLESLVPLFNGVGVSYWMGEYDIVIQKGSETIVIATADTIPEAKRLVEELTIGELINFE